MNNKIKFKKFKIVFSILMFLFILLNYTDVKAASTGWVMIDGNSNSGISASESSGIPYVNGNSSTVFYKNSLYTAFVEVVNGFCRVRVKKFDTTTSTWSYVDGSSIGRNRAEKDAQRPSMIVFNNELYLIWDEAVQTVYVDKYDGTTWTKLDTVGLNKDTSKSASEAKLCVYNNKVYAAWGEQNASNYNIRVSRYDGGTTWTFIDGNLTTGINYNNTQAANKPCMAVYDNALYVAWTEISSANNVYQMRVKKYDGTSWTSADNNLSLNLNTANRAERDISFVSNNNNKLYLSWFEYDSAWKASLVTKEYNGSSWETVPDASTPNVNKFDGKDTTNPYLLSDGTNLY
jgi:hypothetical protein